MALDPSKPLQQQKVPAGTVLFEAGVEPALLCLLHQGEVGAFNKYFTDGKRRMYAMGPNSVPGFGSLISQRPYSAVFVTTKESLISAFPVKPPFSKMILGKLNVGVMAVRSIAQEVVATQQMIRKFTSYLSNLQIAVDNLSIAYYRCNPDVFQATGGGEVIDPVLTGARVVLAEFEQNGGQIPEPIQPAWLQADHSGQLRKNYEFQSSFDTEQFTFLRRMLALPSNIQGAVFKTDLNILDGLGKRLNVLLEQNILELYQLQESVDVALESLYNGDYCFAEKFFLLADVLDSGMTKVSLQEFSTILRFMADSSQVLLRNYQALQGIAYNDVTPSLQKISEFLNTNVDVKAAEAKKAKVESVSNDVEAIKQELSGSADKIMAYLEVDPEDRKQMKELLKKFKDQKNPMDSGGDPRKIRRQINTIYWKIWEKGYYKFKSESGNVPRPVELMLRFGFFDDDLLDDEHLEVLYGLKDSTSSDYDVVEAIDWIDRIREKETPTSVDEMGLTYFEKLKQEHKEGWKRETDIPDEVNTAERRIHYEINSLVEVNVRLTSGSPTTAFPLLTRHQIVVPLDNAQVTKEKLTEAINELLKLDFSAFHREVILNDEEKGILKEFVQMKVMPTFIIMPSIGTKMMMWQELSSRAKNSPGRITVPVFATADLFTLLLEAVAAFRWELTKTIMGADWNNVAQSSITADYTDYVQFYKKNRDLSVEQKEKLGTEFKRFRNDRDRFTNDYINWMKYEANGVLKLNKVARNIFYKHVPFSKDLRDNLAAQPAYSEIHNRFKNIRNRKVKELEVRYRKYGDDIPAPLKANLDFYSV